MQVNNVLEEYRKNIKAFTDQLYYTLPTLETDRPITGNTENGEISVGIALFRSVFSDKQDIGPTLVHIQKQTTTLEATTQWKSLSPLQNSWRENQS